MVKITTPQYNLIEKTAYELACTWYEIGRFQGMTSKWRTPRLYARANLEKFIPKAIEHLLDMMANPNNSEHVKNTIYLAIQERVNDPELNKYMPNPDIAALAQQIFEREKKQVIEINTTLNKALDEALKPPLAQRH